MQSPLVSVIIPCYNHEKYVGSCVESIVNQDYPNFELIVIDDGSKDKSPEIIKTLSEKYDFHFFLQENIGLTATLNKALKAYAKGKYVIILASDDIMYPERISKQVEFMEKNPQFGISYSNALVINEDSEVVGQSKTDGKSGWLFKDLFLAKMNIPAYTCIYRYEALEKVGFYDEKAFIEDSDMYYKISRLYQIGYLNILAAYYRRHGGNMSKRFLELYADTFRRIEKYKDDPDYPEAVLQAKKRWFFLLSYKNKTQALKLFPSVIERPFNKFFIGGCINLLGLSFMTKKHFK